MKEHMLHHKAKRLDGAEVLKAMSICAATNPMAELALSKLPELSGCEAHSTVLLTRADEDALRRLGLFLTSDPNIPENSLYRE
jgi:uncharacterized protein (UPF0371 family)